ncbi:MAG TPA: hypothetical protein PLJ34_05140 [Hyphomicrobiales bacterium]|nr:hypothetical protein [Kaistiaceae bacterium]HQF30813.1 hypothetical protein [Hyphomicrobiales bacterium]
MSNVVLLVALTIGAAFLADNLAWQKGRSRRGWVIATVLFFPLVLVLAFLPKVGPAAGGDAGTPS